MLSNYLTRYDRVKREHRLRTERLVTHFLQTGRNIANLELRFPYARDRRHASDILLSRAPQKFYIGNLSALNGQCIAASVRPLHGVTCVRRNLMHAHLQSCFKGASVGFNLPSISLAKQVDAAFQVHKIFIVRNAHMSETGCFRPS